MSIASAIQLKQQQVAAAYTACDEKGATMPAAGSQNLSNLASTIATISGGGPAPAAKQYTVTWYDYDGTVLKEDTVDEGGSSTAPTVPSHELLTFREWVHGSTLTNVTHDYFNIARHAYLGNGFVRKVHIGEEQDYTLRIWARKANGTNSSVLINWGDGTTETFSEYTENIEVSHTYADEFSGFVTMTIATGSTLKTPYNKSTYEYGVEEYYIGSDVTFDTYCNFGRWNKSFKALVLPDTATSLPQKMFVNYSPKVIALPQTVTSIGANLLYEMLRQEDQFEAINIPQSVTSIGTYAFNNNNLKFITDTLYVTKLYNGCFQNVICDYGITFVDTVTTMEGGIFTNSKFKTISIASGTFTSLGNYGGGCFGNMSNLEEVTLPSSLPITTLANETFRNCDKLRVINNFPKNATSIGNEIFFECHSLITPIEFNNITSLGNGVFSGCQSVESISLDGTFTALNKHNKGMFQECYALSSLTLPNTITKYDNQAFMRTYSLRNLPISTSLTSVGISVFEAVGAETIELPDTNVITISYYNFRDCRYTKSVKFGNGVTISNTSEFFKRSQFLTSIDCGEGWIPNTNIPNMNDCPFLTAESMVSFFTHLGDNTGNTARTLTFGATNLAKLTTSQKEIATNKNYTLA